jgi:xylulokinase
MGLFDMETAHWAENLLNLVGLQTQQMPDALPPGSFLGNISQAASVETGLPPGMPVVAGIGDGQAAGLGCNIHSPGMAYLSLGTSVISGTYSSGFQTSNAFRTMFGGVPGSFLFETVLLGGTYTISWFIERFLAPFLTGDPNQYLQELEFQAGQIPPGCEGLLLVPYWNSAMNPYWDSSASGIVVGWNGRHTPAHLYRAILEGIAFELRLQIEGVERSLGETIHQLMVMGGGAKSNLWCQVIANITGKSIQRTITPEAAALGAGMIAAGSLGIHPDIASASRAMCKLESQIFVPIPDLHTMYSRLYHDAYLPLFPSIQEPLQHLASITRP